ncbi:hypothetical protein A2690_03070 [Candidatus Roizmanbacteria bacterium RIFCSPHIGHO2_01_FULL_39_12b]|uniref:Bacterial Ig-like domain-containing protein n=1 Tax=Candidatus Roizmanbacteria bacterium RIFCSPHIGHO2_01_FULL_39_12b TaxID=1802030 RepID=A0A1F7G986_9BACT|nr:MAG: hypothetical protein A2690_03070 [Candidatus Roizmanbacteria bacterium RIFCSPHIGHO2_01_FULL_39_12b]OGK45962.1 MAG: hypothetical protein A3B46_00180 [Candidatus Roizmanbacteria bacterium RIFCSPLOWO2_01_FULL_39_19]
MYYKLAYRNNEKIPLFLLFGVGVVILSLIIVLIKPIQTNIKPSINKANSLLRLDIAGITNNNISFYFRTADPTVPEVAYSKTKNKDFTKMYDVRDTENSQTPRRNHLFALEHATAATAYFFKINNASPFTVKTATRVGESSPNPIYGKIANSSGKPISDAVIFIKFKKSYPLVTLSKQDGTFLLSTCCIIDATTLESKTVLDTDEVTAEIISEDGDQLIVYDYLSSMVPFNNPLTFSNGSKTIDNRVVKEKKSTGTSPILGVSEQINTKKESFSIIYPASESSVPFGSPLLKGTGQPGETIRLSLKKTKYSTSTTVDSTGLWRGQFATKLNPGNYELIAESSNDFGKPVVLNRIFTITKSGEQVLGSATDSATFTPTPVSTAEATITPPAGRPPTTTLETATPAPPVSGGFNMPIIIIASIALIVMGAGIILIF